MSKPLILAVDDDEAVRVLLTSGLERAGYAVRTAQDGTTGLLAAQQHHPDLIILDIGLPGGDGLIVLQRLKRLASFKDTPVIVLTGKGKQEWQQRALDAGAVAFLTKPVDGRALLGRIKELIPSEEARALAPVRCPHCGHAVPLSEMDPRALRALAERLEAEIL